MFAKKETPDMGVRAENSNGNRNGRNGDGGNAINAAARPPMGGDGAAGWDEGTSQFGVPQTVVPPVSASTAAAAAPDSLGTHQENGSMEKPAEGDSPSHKRHDYRNSFPPPMRPPTPPAHHWSVRRPS